MKESKTPIRWLLKPETKKLIRDRLGFKSIREVEDFFENLDVVIEIFSDELKVDKDFKLAKVKLGKYLILEKRLKEQKEGWKMPDGTTRTVPEKIVYNAVLNSDGKDLPNITF